MRRFLSRSSITHRLVGLLVLSVVAPGLVLAWYGVRAVLQEETLYQATLKERAESLATGLAGDLEARLDRLLGALDAAVVEGGARWVTDPGSAAERLIASEPLVSSALVLDGAGKLRWPTSAATSVLDRRGGESADRTYLGPLLQQGERLEFQAGDLSAAAAAYAAAAARIPGGRGRAIAAVAEARCLLKNGKAEEALARYVAIATEHADERDLNDFPLGLLARFQSALALQALDRRTAAAERLLWVLDDLLNQPWTFGGYGETAIGQRALAMLEGGLLAAVPESERIDPAFVAGRLADLVIEQARQAQLLALLPTLVPDRPPVDGAGGFELLTLQASDRTLLVAHRWWRQGGESRRLLVPLDSEALREEMQSSLNSAARATPEFKTVLVPTGTAPDLGEGFAVRHPLDPSLPGYTLEVRRGEILLGATRSQQRLVRVGMIVGLLVIILVGIAVISRAISREVEIARLKSDFVSSVSHELRTPLTTIRIMAEMLSLGAVPSGEKQAEYHRNIVSEAERLTRLINNVLDFARIEEGRKKFQFGMGDLADAVFEVERITGDYVRKEGFTLSTTIADDLPATAFDRDAVIQSLINLMSNAVKYSSDDKTIEMGAEQVRDNVVLWVADRGPGIDPKDVPHLFEKFFRGGDHMTREVGGTGLGLAIVNHIVGAHGGRVNVKTKPGEGSRFELIFPVQTVDQLEQSEKRR